MPKISTINDKEHVAAVRKAIAENDGYCPCKLEQTPDTKCMCKEFRDMIADGKEGVCHCGLYIFSLHE